MPAFLSTSSTASWSKPLESLKTRFFLFSLPSAPHPFPSPPHVSMYPNFSSPSNAAVLIGPYPSWPTFPDLRLESGFEACDRLSNAPDVKHDVTDAEQSSLSRPAPRVSTLARRIHGWSWQAVRLHARVDGIVFSMLIIPLTRISSL
jgi:hypothetical protein